MDPRHLYVHVPFCARRCTYCDFAIAVRRVVPVDEYLDSIRRELDIRSSTQQSLDSVYLGGGTPSRLGAEGVARLIAIVRERFEVTSETEVTIEANPDDVDSEQASAWRRAGINRVSLGIQSFDDRVLAWMHRVHDSRQALDAFHTLRGAGFDNISLDLIFALPRSLDRSWTADLHRALDLKPEHISLYGLTIEHSTPLARWTDRGSIIPADEEMYSADFLLADQQLTSAGYEHYEVSNFARPGRMSRHNSAYWSGSPYLGIGPSAHSFDGDTRSWNVAQYADWSSRLTRCESVIAESERLTDENRTVVVRHRRKVARAGARNRLRGPERTRPCNNSVCLGRPAACGGHMLPVGSA